MTSPVLRYKTLSCIDFWNISPGMQASRIPMRTGAICSVLALPCTCFQTLTVCPFYMHCVCTVPYDSLHSPATILWILVKKGSLMVSDWRECFTNACLALRPKDLPMASPVGNNAYFFTTPWYVTTTCIIQNNTFVIKVSL